MPLRRTVRKLSSKSAIDTPIFVAWAVDVIRAAIAAARISFFIIWLLCMDELGRLFIRGKKMPPRDNADGKPMEGTPSALKDQDQIEIDTPIFLPTRPCFLIGPSRTPANRTFITFTG